MNTGGEKKVKRLRYYIIYKDRREVKDNPAARVKKGVCAPFCHLFKVLFLDARRQRQKYISLAFFSGFRRRQETGGNRVCARAA